MLLAWHAGAIDEARVACALGLTAGDLRTLSDEKVDEALGYAGHWPNRTTSASLRLSDCGPSWLSWRQRWASMQAILNRRRVDHD